MADEDGAVQGADRFEQGAQAGRLRTIGKIQRFRGERISVSGRANPA
jgi:hypothetical protein